MSSSISAVFDVCNCSNRRALPTHGHTSGIKMELVRCYPVFDFCRVLSVLCITNLPFCYCDGMDNVPAVSNICVIQVEKVKPLRAVVNWVSFLQDTEKFLKKKKFFLDCAESLFPHLSDWGSVQEELTMKKPVIWNWTKLVHDVERIKYSSLVIWAFSLNI